MYELWATQGQGGSKELEFKTLEEALKFVEDHFGQASFGIKYPDGTWHKW